jgi:hypothetical protein
VQHNRWQSTLRNGARQARRAQPALVSAAALHCQECTYDVRAWQRSQWWASRRRAAAQQSSSRCACLQVRRAARAVLRHSPRHWRRAARRLRRQATGAVLHDVAVGGARAHGAVRRHRNKGQRLALVRAPRAGHQGQQRSRRAGARGRATSCARMSARSGSPPWHARCAALRGRSACSTRAGGRAWAPDRRGHLVRSPCARAIPHAHAESSCA